MHRLPQIVITVILLTLRFQPSSGQNYSPDKKELKVLKEELNIRAKENKHNLDENLVELRKRGYPLEHWDWITNKSLKELIAIDDRLIVMQSELDSTIHNLKNGDLISDMSNPVQNARYYGSVDNDDQFSDLYREFTNRLSRLRKQYYSSVRPGSSDVNDTYLQAILEFNKPNDKGNLMVLEQRLLNRKQLYEQRDKVVAERKQKDEEQEKQRQEAIRTENEQRRIEEENELQRNQKLQAEIALLPSKANVNTKFRTYKHKTGHVFEMFPVGFTPKPNKSSYDKVQILGRVYTVRYREHDDYGINSLIIEFYNSGRISKASVYNGDQLIYVAKYRDGADKAYEIFTKTPDDKFHLRIDRTYGDAGISYYYEPLDYYYD